MFHKQLTRLVNGHYRSFSTSALRFKELNNITVVGAGLMGSGIAQVAAQANCNVTVVDTSNASLENGKTIISRSLQRVARKKFADNEDQQKEYISKVLANIHLTTDANASVRNADLVVEAIVENIETKHKLFESMDQSAPQHTIFCSNTSSLSIRSIADATSPERQKRFAGLHFFNPVPAMKLVEIVRTDRVTREVLQDLNDFAKKIGKTPVACKDTPGFIVNRLLVPYMMEAFRIVDRGEASIPDIDTAMKLGAGMPMGPLELADLVGLDTMKSIVDGWADKKALDPSITQPSPTLEELCAKGDFGRKSGKGFYDYSKQ
ncbi:Hydroxyacyl-coenzyme A dehydrogenase, mitochondrial [Choanephora cucurbitarum]|uniref:3-hydroxyacyl-CoA dehydrogenase n=1 Tax=Choanephora cucurbitarum TaxID=101091 RepID=A0A1C7NK03_9FUNG|nr:Hydroxyacyl-coenzyme A dehydrogenase, mitochondrial [Choanephora cucurbitarum]